MAKGDLAIRTPDNLSDEEAATLGVAVSTVGQGLYQALKLPLPTAPATDSPPILIWGGATATGLLGIQFAALSGYQVHATSSPAQFDYLRSLGAAAVYDYRSPSVSADIKAATGGKLKVAWDCVASEETGRAAAEALADEGGAYASLLPVPDEVIHGASASATNALTLAYTVFGEPFEKFKAFPAVPADYEFAKTFWELSRGLLAEGKIRPARGFVNRDGKKGLEGVLAGLQELREDKVRGGKLVYTL